MAALRIGHAESPARQMVDRIDRVSESLRCEAGVLEVSLANLNTIADGGKVFGPAAREIIDHHHVAPLVDQVFHQRRSDQSGTAGHEDTLKIRHDRSFRIVR